VPAAQGRADVALHAVDLEMGRAFGNLVALGQVWLEIDILLDDDPAAVLVKPVGHRVVLEALDGDDHTLGRLHDSLAEDGRAHFTTLVTLVAIVIFFDEVAVKHGVEGDCFWILLACSSHRRRVLATIDWLGILAHAGVEDGLGLVLHLSL